MTLDNWLNTFQENTTKFIKSLTSEKNGLPAVVPAAEYATEQGKKTELPWLCFAAKTHYMLGNYDKWSDAEKNKWINKISSFQHEDNKDITKSPYGENAFCDRGFMGSLPPKDSVKIRIKNYIKGIKLPPPHDRALLGETKQAMATLRELGASPELHYTAFPLGEKEAIEYFNKLDWSLPWAAGGQASCIVTLAAIQNTNGQYQDTLEICRKFFKNIADSKSGAYFKDPKPEYDNLVNGAMKVLTALAWLNEPVHYPQKLIDTVLLREPASEGCHLVDALYVLHQCSLQTDYRKNDIENYCRKTLVTIGKHYHETGGFSYYKNSSQTHYNVVNIIHGRNHIPDIHGTVLLVWALALVSVMIPDFPVELNLIKP